MVNSYIRKDESDKQRRGPKPKQIENNIKKELLEFYTAGVPIAKLCRKYNLSYHIVKKCISSNSQV